LKFSAYPGKVMQGKIMAISPVINPEDKTCKVFITVKNPDEIIKPGMHAEVEIAAEIFKDRLLVPQDAVLIRDNRKLIFAIEDGIAKWKYIDIGLENEDYAEVLNTDNTIGEIKEGMKVIVEGHFTMRLRNSPRPWVRMLNVRQHRIPSKKLIRRLNLQCRFSHIRIS